MTVKLVVENVSKSFSNGKESVVALDKINLNINYNELAVIVGPSGCGKSTLLNMVSGLDKPSQGRILMDGQEITGPGPERGMVFQSYTLFPWLDVQKNVEFGLKIRNVSSAQRAEIADHYLKLVGLDDFRHALPKNLSGGMKQRVALARALANKPEVLLMDEPFGALDAQTRVVMQELLLKVWEESKTTVLFITHDIDEAIFLADKLYVMSRHPGKIKMAYNVGFTRPRDHRLMAKVEFAELKGQVVELLWEDSHQAANEV